MKENNCFGFYVGGPVCTSCVAVKRCRAILVSDGFDLAAALLDELIASIPDNAQLIDTNRVSEQVSQILNPTLAALSSEEQDLMGLLE